MTRILICTRGYPPDIVGGGEISTGLIAAGLSRLGMDVHILTFTNQSNRIETIQNVPVHRLKCPNVYWSIEAARQPKWKKCIWHLSQAYSRNPATVVQKAIQKINPAILHTSSIEDFSTSIWPWAKSQGITTVHSLRSYTLLHRQATLYDAKSDRQLAPDFLSRTKRKCSQSATGVIGISNCILRQHLDHQFFSRSKSVVIGNPIADPIVEAPRKQKNPLRIGILGRISPEKGIEAFLHCLENFRYEEPWELNIAGKGSEDYVDRLKQIASKLPVRWQGWRPSRDFLSELDLLVVPSRWHEPFGRIIVEAYSVGLPVLCLRRGALPELVAHGTTGWILDDWDPDSIAVAFNRCRSLDRQSIRRVAKEFTPTKIAQEHARFYQSLL